MTSMRARNIRRPKLGVLALCVVCLLLFVWPVAMLAYGTLRTAPPGQGGRWSTSGLTSALTSWDVWHSFINSLVLSAATVALSTALAIYLAWLVTRTRTPLRRIVTPVAVLIFAVPPMFYTLSWAMLGQQPGGLIDKALHGMFGAAPVNVQSWYGLIIVSVLGATAAQYLLLLGPFQALNPALEEASLVCGASRLRSVFQIEIPALGPAILGVMILGFVLGMGLLTTPLLLGEPAGIYVLPTEIYRLIEGETPADYAGASTLSLLLVLVVLALVAIQSKLLGQRKFVTVTGKSARREAIDIGRWKWLGTLVIVIFTLFALVLPLGQFVLGSFESYFGVYSHFTTGNYSTVFHQPGTSQAFTTTIMVAVVSGFVATLLAVLITLVSQRSQSRLRRLPDLCVWLLWAVPGITLSLGIIWAYSFGENTSLTHIGVTGTLANYAHAVRPLYLGIIWKSLWFAAATTALCLIAAFPVAIAITFASEKTKVWLLLLIMLPFWTNLLIRTYALMAVLRDEGYINFALAFLWHGASQLTGALCHPLPPFRPLELLHNNFAVVFGLVYVQLPFMVLPLYAALDRLDRSLLEASLDLGAGHGRTFARIVVPLAMPGVIASALKPVTNVLLANEFRDRRFRPSPATMTIKKE